MWLSEPSSGQRIDRSTSLNASEARKHGEGVGVEPVVGVVGVGVLGHRPAEAVHRGVNAGGVAGRGGGFHEVADQNLSARVGEEAALGGPDGVVVALGREAQLGEVVRGVDNLLGQRVDLVRSPRLLRGGRGERDAPEQEQRSAEGAPSPRLDRDEQRRRPP